MKTVDAPLGVGLKGTSIRRSLLLRTDHYVMIPLSHRLNTRIEEGKKGDEPRRCMKRDVRFFLSLPVERATVAFMLASFACSPVISI